ncbi:MAG: hypothetical protein RL748_1507 [Pseudomonadota bacterium]|jgi:leucyl aminopeptidase
MLRSRILPLLIASTLLCVGNTSMAAGKKVWITLGDAAYAQLQKIQPGILATESKLLNNGVTDTTGNLKSQEQVYLVQVEEDLLPEFSATLHEDNHRCGGFIFHASQAEGSAALNRTLSTPTFAQTRPSYIIRNQAAVNAALPLMQDANIAQTITDLSTNFPNRYFNTSGGVNASNWLKNKWQTMAQGRSDISVSQIAHGWAQSSVMLTINGSDNGAEVVVIGAHLDSINLRNRTETAIAPGADDDASGVASMTEALRAMLASNYKPRRTIKLIAYAAEEVGLRGSGEIAKDFYNRGVNVVGVLQLDMTNYKGSANDIYIFGDYTDRAQNTFLENLITTYQPTLTVGRDVCNYGCSDHASWNNNGYPASMPFEATLGQSNKNIHTTADTLANSGNQALHALKFAKLAASFAIELGSEGPGAPVPADKTEYFFGPLAAGESRLFGPFKVGAGGALRASTTGLGDMDLYVRKNATPSTSSYDCRSAGATATELCRLVVDSNTDGWVRVVGDSAGSFKLIVSYRPQSAPVSTKLVTKPVSNLKR